MKKLKIIILLMAISGCVLAQNNHPVIDMHLHAISGNMFPNRMCFPEPCEKVPSEVKNSSELLPATINQMDEHHIVLGALSSYDYELTQKWVKEDSRFMTGVAIGNPLKVDYDLLEKHIQEGKIKILGEITTQYQGFSVNAPEMDTVFAIAEKYDLPVWLHFGGIGGSPHFPIEKGNPLDLNEVIRKHPKLRIYVENAAWPFGDEMIALMYINPNVYADLSTVSWVIPRTTFHGYLKKLIDAGLSKRLMFGTDQMYWPETISIAIESINTADFLTEEQKRDIFYNNAARFLRLSDEEIAKHHGK
jgi:predicted TIM-barrel fold metal-dependent hydrolase